jgi:glutamate-1-semialdehyde 2,1-aminomutase
LGSITKVSTKLSFQKSLARQEKAHSVIPGGAHTYAKGDDQYPTQAPGFIVRGAGSHVWDLDGNQFIEYGMGLRSVTLGHGFGTVVEAAHKQMQLGSNFTRPATIELECAEELLTLVPGAEMVKFAKDGSDVTSAAVRLSRAYTGRDLVARCGDHPFFAVDDWFIGDTPMNAGIPKAIQELTVRFSYNDLESLRKLFSLHPHKIACVIMEAETVVPPAKGFLEQVQELCHTEGALFILDEMITGFRWDLGGAQKYYGIVPDLSTFGKAIANGFPLSVLVGKKQIMELGGILHPKERVFLLSTTHGGETPSMAAAIATMRVYKDEHVIEHLYRQGERLREGIDRIIESLHLQGHFEILGKAPNLVYATRDATKKPSQAFRALFLQETIQQGLLLPSLVVSYSHTDQDIDRTTEGIGEALVVYRKALEDGVEKYLVGRPVKPVFRKFN